MAQRFKRIAKELQLFNASPVKNIYLDFSENNLAVLHILMIGQRYTPYSRMFLRFCLEFPDDYPLKPPKIALTSSYDRKIHPNVFPGGWICLSTLNVGDSSGWVPSISLSALLITIYSMFTAEMIQIDNTHINERSTKFFPPSCKIHFTLPPNCCTTNTIPHSNKSCTITSQNTKIGTFAN